MTNIDSEQSLVFVVLVSVDNPGSVQVTSDRIYELRSTSAAVKALHWHVFFYLVHGN